MSMVFCAIFHTKCFFVLFIVCLLYTACCNSNSHSEEAGIIVPLDAPQLPSRGFFMGILPTPANNQSFDEAYTQSAQHAEFVPVWGRPTPFYNLAADLRGSWGETFVNKLIRGNGMFPIIHLSFFEGSGTNIVLTKPPGMENATLNNPAWRSSYKQAAIDVLKASRPRYLSLGNEVNRWYEVYGTEGENGFIHYITLYEEIYDKIKKLSPQTVVFCTFAREIVCQNREANLEVLSLFNPNKVDMLIFTSYPYATGKSSPSKLPDDYYAKAVAYMPGKPFGFSEIAWTALDAFGGEDAQEAFIRDVVNRLTRERGINLFFFGWCWLHDLSENDAAVGLIKFNGIPRKGYQTWMEISQ